VRSHQIVGRRGSGPPTDGTSANWRIVFQTRKSDFRAANIKTAKTATAKSKTGKTRAAFIEPMLLLRSETLPEGPEWLFELKLDGYRALAIKTGRKVELRSRNDNDFTSKYPLVAKGLAALPDETVIDGELVAFDASGRPSFNALQNQSPGATPVYYYLFDVLVLAGRNLIHETLDVRLGVLDAKVLPKLREPIRHSRRSVKRDASRTAVRRRAPSKSEPAARLVRSDDPPWGRARIIRQRSRSPRGRIVSHPMSEGHVNGV
jgi:ATP-dependent DNA ligase